MSKGPLAACKARGTASGSYNFHICLCILQLLTEVCDIGIGGDLQHMYGMAAAVSLPVLPCHAAVQCLHSKKRQWLCKIAYVLLCLAQVATATGSAPVPMTTW